jgi:hypothetical protein
LVFPKKRARIETKQQVFYYNLGGFNPIVPILKTWRKRTVYLFPILMKRFLIRTSICGIAAIGICFLYLIVIGLNYGNKFDPYYGRLTSLHPQGLIIGSSRSAQALEPKYIADNLYNFSFTLATSSYDQSYLNFIKQKK